MRSKATEVNQPSAAGGFVCLQAEAEKLKEIMAALRSATETSLHG